MFATIMNIVGWCGAALVVISMLMTDMKKLRAINILGSTLSVVSCLAIANYSMAAMNTCLVIINIYHLIKSNSQAKAGC